MACAFLCFTPAVQAISWTETFDAGFGRLDTTVGDGATDYTYNAGDQNLDASFVRGLVPSDRLALLGATYDQNSVAGMSVDITPLSLDGGRPRLGFFDSTSGSAVLYVELDNARLPGRIAPLSIGETTGRTEFFFTNTLFWDFNETYRLDIDLNGGANEISLTASSVGPGGVTLLQQETFGYAGSEAFAFDAVGIGNVNDPSGEGAGKTFEATIDNVSFRTPNTTAVPEPMTTGLTLLGFGALGLRLTRRGTRRA